MAIRVNLGLNPVNLATPGDNILYQLLAGIDRYHIGAANIYNDTVGTATINVFISPDLTSASGKKVDEIKLGSKAEVDINSIIGQGYTDNVIVTTDVAVIGTITVTEYTAGL
jgi:hypothetical protein